MAQLGPKTRLLRDAAIVLTTIVALVWLGWDVDGESHPGLAPIFQTSQIVARSEIPIPEAAFVVEVFDRLVLSVSDPPGLHRPYRWNGAVRVYFAGDADQAGMDATKSIWREAARYSGLDVGFGEAVLTANLDVHFAPDEAMLQVMRGYGAKLGDRKEPPLGYHLGHDVRHGSIRQSRIIVRSTLVGASLERSLRHETMHALGISGHPDESVASVLAPRTKPLFAGFTLIDKLLVRTLYDPRIPVGADVKLARVLARNIIAELVEELRAGGDPDRILAHPNAKAE
jgi:hypothetical protein